MLNEKAPLGRGVLPLPWAGAKGQEPLTVSLSRVLRLADACLRDTRQVGSALRQRVGLALPTRTAPHRQRGRTVVAQAMGVVMADCHCSADEAYRALLDTARETGRGLIAIATDVVDSTAPCVPALTDL